MAETGRWLPRVLASLALLMLAITAVVMPVLAETIDKGDGIHSEDWFLNTSFGDLGEEVAAARHQGKLLAVIWEQQGCSACAKLHAHTLQDPAVRSYIDQNFVVIALNTRGETDVVAPAPSGAEAASPLAEKALAAQQRVSFTPTTLFFDADGKEVFRLAGYFPPFAYLSGFVFVAEQGYSDPQTNGVFLRWTKAHRDRLVAAYGGEPSAHD